MREWFAEVWHELRPIINHCIAAITICSSVWIVGQIIKMIEATFPDHDYTILETIDLYTAYVNLTLFAAASTIRILVSIIKQIRKQWNETV